MVWCWCGAPDRAGDLLVAEDARRDSVGGPTQAAMAEHPSAVAPPAPAPTTVEGAHDNDDDEEEDDTAVISSPHYQVQSTVRTSTPAFLVKLYEIFNNPRFEPICGFSAVRGGSSNLLVPLRAGTFLLRPRDETHTYIRVRSQSGETIIVHSKQDFEKQILRLYFKHSNFASFVTAQHVSVPEDCVRSAARRVPARVLPQGVSPVCRSPRRNIKR